MERCDGGKLVGENATAVDAAARNRYRDDDFIILNRFRQRMRVPLNEAVVQLYLVNSKSKS
jgi:hypothetical protein